MSTQHTNIEKSIVVFVEGNDDKKLIDDLLNLMNIADVIQVINTKGKDKIPEVLASIIRHPAIDDVKVLAVIGDADRNPQQSMLTIEKHLTKAGLPSHLQTKILIVPSNGEGMLEDVCMESVATDPVMSCVESYLKCIEPNVEELPRNPSKSRFLAYMATRPKATNGTVEAALQKGFFDLNSSAFTEIRDFLTSLMAIA